MAELAMLADIQRTVYHEEVTRKVHVMAQVRENLPIIDQRSNHCATPPTGLIFFYLFQTNDKARLMQVTCHKIQYSQAY